MESGGADNAAERTARRCLEESVAQLTGAAEERRHETLMEWAEGELGLDRGYAEQIYGLAEEEQLPPTYALLLVHCGIGVRELEAPEAESVDASGAAAQQAPPEWVGEGTVELDDVVLERRLRATFRRLRSHLEDSGGIEAALQTFLAEPDVTPLPLR